ncbi:polyprenyl synthetase family protein [Candidatus Parcubacteria bacterium]|nr:MAG: polyprenyl synthetase family protein [Candidatus Parcubacteria bacterium]
MSIETKLQKIRFLANARILEFFKAEENKLTAGLNAEIRNIMSQLERFCLGGKKIRIALAYFSYLACGGKSKKKFFRTAVSLELFHNFFLIHDDIIDKDNYRRNKLTFHKYFGEKRGDLHYGLSLAIIGADLLNFFAYKNLDNSRYPEKVKNNIRKLFSVFLSRVCLGEFLDIYFAKVKKVSAKELLFGYDCKTGGYTTTLPVVFGAHLAGASYRQIKELTEFSGPLGQVFQIKDDILDVFGNKSKFGKDPGSDLLNGKKTILLDFVMKNADCREKKYLNSLANKRKLLFKDIFKIRKIIRKSGAITYFDKYTENLVFKAKAKINKKNFNRNVCDLLALADYFLIRSS